MTKTYAPDSTREDLQELTEIVKSTAAFLNTNPDAKALLEDPETRNLSEDEFISRLFLIINRAGIEK